MGRATIMMRTVPLIYICMVAALLAACAPATEPSSVVQIGEVVAPQSAIATSGVVYVTPTQAPTSIPTAVPYRASATPSQTPSLPATADPQQLAAQCDALLTDLYASASELCIGEPSGYICNGGLPPEAQPVGAVSNALALPGALVEAQVVHSLRTPPLLMDKGGGIAWLHMQDTPVAFNALMIGDVEVQNATPDDLNLPDWQALRVRTNHPDKICDTLPNSALIVQGPYGQTSRIVINGVSIDLNGTLIVQTQGLETYFIVIEGQARLIAQGVSVSLLVGQQVSVPYSSMEFIRPAGAASNPVPLSLAMTENLPAALMDRPVQLPQPGYALTNGRVNMRAEPNIEGQLLYQVPPNEVLSILGENSERTWSHVRLGNAETGWMRSDLLARSIGQIEAVYDQTPVPPQRLGNIGNQATVRTSQGANLRSAPDVNFSVIRTLTAGTEITLLARSPYSPWVQVDTGSEVGWMALITLDTRAAIQFLPIDYNVPLPPRPTATPVFNFGGGHAYPDPSGGS